MIMRVPGDKSISQRALILAALADGQSRLRGVLPAADPRSTAGALRALGAAIEPLPADGAEIRVEGRGLRGLTTPDGPLDLGNSGTGTRLLLGVLAGQRDLQAVLDGDASLRSRPMGRVTGPLGAMGGRFRSLEAAERLPIEVVGGALRAVDLELPVASAQVKSAVLLAGLTAGVSVALTEPGASRDHTERMLRECGVAVSVARRGEGRRIEMPDPPARIPPLDFDVPGDLSSAAFLFLAALLGVGGGELTVADVGLNPTRAGVLELLRRMGAAIAVEEAGETDGGEPTGSVTVAPGRLHAIEVDQADVVAAIDEIPVVAVAAARAEGTTRITGAAELRVKETDRIRALALNLRAVGVGVEELDDGLEIEGSDRPLAGTVDAFDDHRIAMAFGVLGAQPGNQIRVGGERAVEVSWPGFWDALGALRGR